MILKIIFVNSKIKTMVANFFVKIEQVIFFPNTVIYKKIKLIPEGKRLFPSSTTVLAILSNRTDALESQPIGRKPPQFY